MICSYGLLMTKVMFTCSFPSYVYIPILPESLLDFLTAPTPFLMGVHMSYKRHIPDLVSTLDAAKWNVLPGV